MNCKTYRAVVEEAVGGASPGAGTSEHFRACRPCRDFYEERRALRLLLDELDRVTAPADFEFRLRARMAAAASAGGPRGILRSARFAPGAASITLAACLVLAIAGSLYLRRAPASSSSTPEAAQSIAPATAEPARTQTAILLPPGSDEELNGTKVGDGVPVSVGRLPRRPRVARVVNAGAQTAAPPEKSAQSVTFHSRTADVIAPGGTGRLEIASGSRSVALPLRSAAEPLLVILRDEHGTPRVMPMSKVSFGSEELVGRLPATASPTDSEGVW